MCFPDPYEHMTDDELDRHFASLGTRQVPISMRMPPALLRELKAEAGRLGMPYQTLVKHVLSEHIARQRRRRVARSTLP
jgi:predicted DNA binding CopG/RHH family protein